MVNKGEQQPTHGLSDRIGRSDILRQVDYTLFQGVDAGLYRMLLLQDGTDIAAIAAEQMDEEGSFDTSFLRRIEDLNG